MRPPGFVSVPGGGLLEADRVILAGIDEAGYGPVLGPLVTASCAFQVPGGSTLDLWRLLDGAVCRQVSGAGLDRLPVVDSKQLYRAGQSLDALETVALAFSGFVSGEEPPEHAVAFLGRHLPAVAGERIPLQRYPWYADGLEQLALPRRADRDEVRRQADRLAEVGERAGVKPVRFAIQPLLAGEFNRQSARLGSKARVLFDLNAALIEDLRGRAAPDRILCDRHGGRRHYSELLRGAFPMEGVEILGEERFRSSYRIGSAGDGFEVTYQVGGEEHGLEVALASILAKYTRELFVEALNRFFSRRVSGLKRTAGYYSDGQRFVEDLQRARALGPEERPLLIRER